jgi:hypothetical protein
MIENGNELPAPATAAMESAADQVVLAGESLGVHEGESFGEPVLVVVAVGDEVAALRRLLSLVAAPETAGGRRVNAERERQVEVGWDAAHDELWHEDRELEVVAKAYREAMGPDAPPPPYWPWAPSDWKPRSRAENLERAGALYQAQLDLDMGDVAMLAEHRDACAAELDELLGTAGEVANG